MNLTIAVLTVGDELINGEMADTNTTAIARILGGEGYRLSESLTVGDVETDIAAALCALGARRDVVIVTGGLGPTGDDLTARAAARAFGRRLVLNDEALRQIRAFFAARNEAMDPRNEKQALLPQKAAILANDRGTAPGFVLSQEKTEFFFLPGVPDEMTAMLRESVLEALHRFSGGLPPRRERVLKVFGLSEVQTEELLEQVLPPGVELAFGVDFPLVHVKLRACGEEAESLLDRGELAARRALDDFIVATGETTLAQNVASLLENAGLTLSLAESCTGGLIAKLLTDVPGSSSFFERGAVTYSNRAKEQWLGVGKKLLEEEGAVSEACALAMARGVRRAAATDLALAVTGIAGPTGGTADKPVGTVVLALVAPGVEQVQRFRFAGDRSQIRLMTACTALEWIRRLAITRLNDGAL